MSETLVETRRRLRRRNRNWLLLVGIGIALTTYYTLAHKYPTPVVGGSFLIFYLLGVILHELGHATAALAAGGAVDYVTLGRRIQDQKPWRIRFLGLRWYLYGLTASGAVHSVFYSTNHYRLRQCFVIAMGPAVNLVLLVLGCVLMTMVPDDADGGLDPTRAAVFGLIAANIYLLFQSVPPRQLRGVGQATANDGLLFWRTLWYSDSEVKQIVDYAQSTRDMKLSAATAEDMSVDELLANHKREPHNLAYLWYLVQSLHEMDDARYSEFVLKLVELPKLSTNTLVSIIDTYLTWQIQHGPPDQPEAADRLSRKLLELDDCITTRGTRGSVLVDLGRLEEGKAILQDVLGCTRSTIDSAYANIFLALAAKSEGNPKGAREYAQAARKFDPTCPALKRVVNLLKPDE